MTLNNFEEQAKERLSKREIQPKSGSWDKVSSVLQEKGNAPKTNYFWYGIAAGFIGLLIISVIFFKPTATEVHDNQIVVSPDKGIDIEHKEMPLEEPAGNPQLKKEAVIAAGKDKVDKKEVVAKQLITNVSPSFKKELNKRVIPTFSEEIIDTKLEEVLAKVKVLESDENTISDAEVDSLLRQAQKEILADRLFKEDNSVDATALLSQVEEELDQSFRDQIFEKLKTGFDKVRTAVADRNN